MRENVNIIATIDNLISELGGEAIEFTPYMIAGLINDVLLELESDKAVTPQMMYRYAKDGRIVKGESRLRYTAVESAVFVLRYIHRNLDK